MDWIASLYAPSIVLSGGHRDVVSIPLIFHQVQDFRVRNALVEDLRRNSSRIVVVTVTVGNGLST